MSDESDEHRSEGGDRDDYTSLAGGAPGVASVGVVPWPLLWRQRLEARYASSDRYPWVVLATALFGLFTVGFTITILAVAVPAMSRDLGATEATLTWVITGPMLAFAIFGPTAGKLGDTYGHRRVYLIGLSGAALFAGATALSWNAESLLAFRILGATLGAACGPASMAMINKLFSRQARVQAMGYWSLVMAGGPVLGVVVGGPVVELFGWRWIFIGQFPVMLVGLVVAFFMLPGGTRGGRQPFDIIGSALLGGTVAFAVLALNRGPLIGWSHPLVVGGFGWAPVGIALFLWRQKTFSHPLIPLEYLRRRNFALPIGALMVTNFAYMGGFIMTPLLLQDVLGYGETRTGLLSIARPLLFAIAGPIAGYLAVRVGERKSALFGAMCVVASMVALAQVAPGTPDPFVVAALGLSGVGMGAVSPAMAASIANAVDERDLGVAGAAQQMMTQVSVVAGIQILQTVQASRLEESGLVGSYSDAYLVGAGVALLGVLMAAFVRSTRSEAAISERLANSGGTAAVPATSGEPAAVPAPATASSRASGG